MKVHIAVDMDDVVVDFIGGVRTSFELEFGEEGLPNYNGSSWAQEVVDFSNHPYFKECGYDDWWGWLRDHEWLWGKVFKAVPGSIGGVKRLRAEGHYMEAITSKPPWAEFAVWQFQGRFRVPFNRITVVSNGQSKLDFTNADIIVDDKRQTCEEFVADGRAAIQFDRGNNFKPSRCLYTAKDWKEVIAHVRNITSDGH